MGLGIMAAIWGFLALTGEVRELETSRFDRNVLLAFRVTGDLQTPVGPRWLQESGRDVTALGGFTALTLISVMAVVLLLLHGRRTQGLIFGATVILAQLAAEAVKHVVDRARPDIVPHHDLVYSSSFPSGHAVMAPVVYLTLAAIVAAGDRRRSVKVLLLIGAAVLVVAIGVSRVYLGVHWPTDVLAGWTMGAAIAVAAYIALHIAGRARGQGRVVRPGSPVLAERS
jgi:undecaprenyl-diphosphatase